MGLCEVMERWPGTRVPRRWWEQTGIDWKATRAATEAAAEKNGEDAVMAEEPELTRSYSELGKTTQGGTKGGAGEEASLNPAVPVERIGVGRRTDLSGEDTKSMNSVVYSKSIKGQSSVYNEL